MKKVLTEIIGVRFDPGTYQLIRTVAQAQGVDSCDFIRVSVKRELARLSFLSEVETKALYVEPVATEEEEAHKFLEG